MLFSSQCKLILILSVETRVPSEHGKMNIREGNTPSLPSKAGKAGSKLSGASEAPVAVPFLQVLCEQGSFLCPLSINVSSMEFTPSENDCYTVAK